MSVKEKYQVIRKKIEEACVKAGRNPEEITVMAVTKYASIEKTKELIDEGLFHIGENRDQEFLNKYMAIEDKAVWHFIGTLQSRKVKNIIDHVDYIHSLDRLSLAKEINKRAKSVASCFVQVNVSGEKSKHGLTKEAVIPFIKQLGEYPNIQVAGLMTMAPNTEDESLIRNCFRTLKQLQKEIVSLNMPYAPCLELSMGMSNDFEIAVEEGATIVRIGRDLVGD